MGNEKDRGNNPENWEKLLQALDDKLQLGLLDYLRRSHSYHFEDNTLFIETSSEDDYDYLTRESVFQQLSCLVHDIVGTEKVVIKRHEH